MYIECISQARRCEKREITWIVHGMRDRRATSTPTSMMSRQRWTDRVLHITVIVRAAHGCKRMVWINGWMDRTVIVSRSSGISQMSWLILLIRNMKWETEKKKNGNVPIEKNFWMIMNEREQIFSELKFLMSQLSSFLFVLEMEFSNNRNLSNFSKKLGVDTQMLLFSYCRTVIWKEAQKVKIYKRYTLWKSILDIKSIKFFYWSGQNG